jgi:ABC-2 type transport system permease protein
VRAALLILAKDLRQRVRDRSVFLWGIVAPLGLAAIFSLILGGVTDTSTIDVGYAVADEDEGEQGSAFVEQVLRPLDAEGLFEIVEVPTAKQAEELAADGDVDAAFVIPEGFTAAVEAGEETSILVIGNVDSATFSQVARSIAGQYAGQINTVGAAVFTYFAVSGEDPDPARAAELIPEALEVPAPLVLAESEASSKQLSAATFYSAAMAILFLFLTVQFGVLGLLEERQNQTLRRLLAAPISRRAVIGGKALTSFVIGIASMTVLVVGTTLLLGAEWGNSLAVAVLVVAGVIAAMGIMFVIAAFANTAEQAGNLQAIVAFVLAMLGGTFFPVAPEGIIGRLSLLTPHAWFLRGLGDVAAGTGAGDAFPAALYIAAFGLVTGVLAQFRMGRVVRP